MHAQDIRAVRDRQHRCRNRAEQAFPGRQIERGPDEAARLTARPPRSLGTPRSIERGPVEAVGIGP